MVLISVKGESIDEADGQGNYMVSLNSGSSHYAYWKRYGKIVLISGYFMTDNDITSVNTTIVVFPFNILGIQFVSSANSVGAISRLKLSENKIVNEYKIFKNEYYSYSFTAYYSVG